MNYICKNCGKFITEEQYKKDQDFTTVGLGCGCLMWLIILLCFFSIILLPIAIILLLKEFNKTPDSTCPYCNAKNSLIPDNTPMAQKLLAENYSEEEQIKIKEFQVKQEEIKKEENFKKVELDKKNNHLAISIFIFFVILYLLSLILK